MRVLAIDLGTAAARAGLFERGGRVLGIERRRLAEPGGPVAEAAEQDPNAWWAAIVDACRALTATHGPGVDAICAVGHGPTCVAVAADFSPTRPAVTWRDRRDRREVVALAEATGVGGWGLGLLPAALWIEANDRPAHDRTRWYLGTWDWIASRLTGVPATTTHHPEAVIESAAGLGLDVDRLPPPAIVGSALGSLTATAAAELGVRAGVPVIGGTFDAATSVVGAGVTEAGQAIDVGGSAGGFALMTDVDRPVGGYDAMPSLISGRWLLGGAMAATGTALDWLVWNVLGGAVERDRLVVEAASVAPGADGLVFLPYLAGERDPINDAHATGAFVGLTIGHGRAHLARAVLEAAALAVRHVATPLLAAGLAVSEMRVAGGPSRSQVWNQIKADVTGFPVAVPAVREAALLGAAILALAAASGETDLAGIARAEVQVEQHLRPDAVAARAYDGVFEQYVGLYPALAGIAEGG